MNDTAEKQSYRFRRLSFAALATPILILSCLLLASCRLGRDKSDSPRSFQQKLDSLTVGGEAVSLFDGKSMGFWKQTDFRQKGTSCVEDGKIIMTKAMDMSGITWTGPLLRMNYEIQLEAMRVDGIDFFCGLTFPVNQEPCTLVLGGWGGTVVGLSNIDYYDAINNETAKTKTFENNKWYRIRLRVTEKMIQAWIDDELIVNFPWPDHKLGVRMEVDQSIPLGIAAWQTTGAVRNIYVHKVDRPADYPELWY
jgi:hypothetical protein